MRSAVRHEYLNLVTGVLANKTHGNRCITCGRANENGCYRGLALVAQYPKRSERVTPWASTAATCENAMGTLRSSFARSCLFKPGSHWLRYDSVTRKICPQLLSLRTSPEAIVSRAEIVSIAYVFPQATTPSRNDLVRHDVHEFQSEPAKTRPYWKPIWLGYKPVIPGRLRVACSYIPSCRNVIWIAFEYACHPDWPDITNN